MQNIEWKKEHKINKKHKTIYIKLKIQLTIFPDHHFRLELAVQVKSDVDVEDNIEYNIHEDVHCEGLILQES